MAKDDLTSIGEALVRFAGGEGVIVWSATDAGWRCEVVARTDEADNVIASTVAKTGYAAALGALDRLWRSA